MFTRQTEEGAEKHDGPRCLTPVHLEGVQEGHKQKSRRTPPSHRAETCHGTATCVKVEHVEQTALILPQNAVILATY